MAITHTIEYKFSGASGALTGSQGKSAGEEVNIDESFGIVTNKEVALTLDVSQLSSFYLLADTACTLKFNDSGTPAPEVSLLAGVPFTWQASTYYTNLLTVDVTTVYVTTAAACRLQGKFLVDPTLP